MFYGDFHIRPFAPRALDLHGFIFDIKVEIDSRAYRGAGDRVRVNVAEGVYEGGMDIRSASLLGMGRPMDTPRADLSWGEIALGISVDIILGQLRGNKARPDQTLHIVEQVIATALQRQPQSQLRRVSGAGGIAHWVAMVIGKSDFSEIMRCPSRFLDQLVSDTISVGRFNHIYKLSLPSM